MLQTEFVDKIRWHSYTYTNFSKIVLFMR